MTMNIARGGTARRPRRSTASIRSGSAAWMQTHIAGFSGPIDVQPVCRRPIESHFPGAVAGPPLCFAAQAAGQAAALGARGRSRVSRARAHLRTAPCRWRTCTRLCEDPEVIGSAFYVMDYVEGRIFWDALLPEVAAPERRAVYSEMVRVLAALHSVDYAAVGLGDFGKPGHYVERQVARWTQQYRASETEKIESMERLIEWLPQAHSRRRTDLHRARRLSSR